VLFEKWLHQKSFYRRETQRRRKVVQRYSADFNALRSSVVFLSGSLRLKFLLLKQPQQIALEFTAPEWAEQYFWKFNHCVAVLILMFELWVITLGY